MTNNNTAIRVHNVSKKYVQRYRPSLRHEAMQAVRGLLKIDPLEEDVNQVFWALKDINFEVKRGETVAIVGRNGAGKTTLLRLLSNITAPTTGSIEINGRFASLVGLGAGFNVERTGLENIYLNAAIYGMSIEYTRSIEQNVIEFSELGEFIDRPVKRYSSGMIARLGFSIAIHILPDVIFLDEILAVGDAAFQKKCRERILEMKEEGKTLMYVSHHAQSIRAQCDRAIMLHRGEMVVDGPVDDVLDQYQAFLRSGEANAQIAPSRNNPTATPLS